MLLNLILNPVRTRAINGVAWPLNLQLFIFISMMPVTSASLRNLRSVLLSKLHETSRQQRFCGGLSPRMECYFTSALVQIPFWIFSSLALRTTGCITCAFHVYMLFSNWLVTPLPSACPHLGVQKAVFCRDPFVSFCRRAVLLPCALFQFDHKTSLVFLQCL
jgi:hypothetical protein